MLPLILFPSVLTRCVLPLRQIQILQLAAQIIVFRNKKKVLSSRFLARYMPSILMMQKTQSYKTDLQIQAILIQQKVTDADGHDSHIVSAHLDIVPHDDDLFEGVADGV